MTNEEFLIELNNKLKEIETLPLANDAYQDVLDELNKIHLYYLYKTEKSKKTKDLIKECAPKPSKVTFINGLHKVNPPKGIKYE